VVASIVFTDAATADAGCGDCQASSDAGQLDTGGSSTGSADPGVSDSSGGTKASWGGLPGITGCSHDGLTAGWLAALGAVVMFTRKRRV